jgi:hypothetical protein
MHLDDVWRALIDLRMGDPHTDALIMKHGHLCADTPMK